MKSSSDIRTAFLNYFHDKDHKIVASSSLVPGNDPTLLFTNAGMVQFKDVFLGLDKRPYNKATTSQRCVRAGGKHNDLENVGYTARHHTFFEMLGNFSFGDYFKHEAIEYAWEFLTKDLGIPESRLWVTVFEDDDEAADIWLNEIGVSKDRFSRCGEKDNFWQMGDTGPCGPCTEIFYDHGEDVPGGPPGSPDQEGDRYIEIWNLVFTQYNRDAQGNLNPIPSPSVDTGMGLERIAAVVQGVHNNYDIDLFKSLIESIKNLAQRKVTETVSLQVVADHIRSCAFLITDGVVPSNEGRGYVLRRIIRRAIRHGNKLGFTEPFFYKLVSPLSELMGEAYPELNKDCERVSQILLKEEERFAETLEQGLKHLELVISEIQGTVIAGEDAFKLYDTYGFPVDLTADIARERGLTLDNAGFEKAMEQQRSRARAASKFSVDMSELPETDLETEFNGYEISTQESIYEATVSALYHDGKSVEVLKAGESGGVILESTPFYAESGGQVGDTGSLSAADSLFNVSDTQKQGSAFVHFGALQGGTLKVGQSVNCSVDQRRRKNIMRNHSATHLLHAALRNVLGEHVTQKGSLVSEDRLRFDFSHNEPVSKEQLFQIETLVNQQILENKTTEVNVMALEDAKKSGAMSLFGEKYDESVRVLKIGGEFSIELCGGTHVSSTGDIGLMKIISESGVAAGVRRIEAVTGEGALDWVNESEQKLNDMAQLLKADRASAVSRLEQQLEKTRSLEKTLLKLQAKQASSVGSEMAAEAEDIEGIKVIARKIEGADANTLRDTVDQLKNKLVTAVLVLASVEGDKVTIIAGVTKDTIGKIKAGEMVNFVAQQVGGKGGGRPDLAQAGGDKPTELDSALASVPNWVRDKLESQD
ncbi:MAG: alanyl-tRNA synthetase [Gammaproteobacteria bacterium]|jgi:alanyl-tRNA synthetase